MRLLLDVADVEASSTANTSTTTHQFFQKDIIFKGDINNSMDLGENLQVAIELLSGSGETIKDYTLFGFGFLDFLLDDLNNNIISD